MLGPAVLRSRRFKAVNDHHGHAIGDAVLGIVSRRLAEVVRPGDVVGRLGGDEFVIIAPGVTSPDRAIEIAERARRSFALPMDVDGLTLTLGSSIGIATTSSGDTSVSTMLSEADLAVYEAKAKGRGEIVLCTDELLMTAARLDQLEHELRSALGAGELALHYQPIIQVRTGAVLAFEALIRWERPGEPPVDPSVFLPVAARSELIVAIDASVLDQVAAQLVRWDEDDVHRGVRVGVNLSPRSLMSPDLEQMVLEPMRAHAVDPARLGIEVSENSIIRGSGDVIEKLDRLRASGIRIIVEDFGTAYSMLARLEDLPIDVLKIDRATVENPGATPLMQMVMATGQHLGVKVVAEGVETSEQADRVAAIGIEAAQGFLYASPAPPDRLLATHPSSASPTSD
ncbi:MAG: bifunctional diguanylate cyclase/phosphodiesterase [Acidimicrobiales bacterium]